MFQKSAVGERAQKMLHTQQFPISISLPDQEFPVQNIEEVGCGAGNRKSFLRRMDVRVDLLEIFSGKVCCQEVDHLTGVTPLKTKMQKLINRTLGCPSHIRLCAHGIDPCGKSPLLKGGQRL